MMVVIYVLCKHSLSVFYFVTLTTPAAHILQPILRFHIAKIVNFTILHKHLYTFFDAMAKKVYKYVQVVISSALCVPLRERSR